MSTFHHIKPIKQLKQFPGYLHPMPLLLTTHPFPETTFGLWEIDESESFFRSDLPLSELEESEFMHHHNSLRRLEWLAARWLLHKLTDAPERLFLAKDAFSKPFFPENQHLACSLSHSKGIVGAFISTVPHSSFLSNVANAEAEIVPRSIGCDIQMLTEKMPRIAHKFLNQEEQNAVQNQPEKIQFDLLHLFWTAKESLYKAYGLKELDFRKNIFVQILAWDGQKGTGKGRVEKGDYLQAFQLIFKKVMISEEEALIWATCLG